MDVYILYELNADEAEAFADTKNQLTSEFGKKAVDEFKILRFLRSKRFNVPRTVQALRENRLWRNKENIDSLLGNYATPKVIEMYFPMYIIGTDREESPVLVFELGYTDMNGLMKSVSVEDILRHVLYITEVGEKFMKDHSENIKAQKWFVIIDCKNFSPLYASNRTFRNFMKNLIQLYERNYPERLKTVYVINTSPTVNLFSKFLRPFLPSSLPTKINYYEEKEWKDIIKEPINPYDLPMYLGGKSEIAALRPLTPINRGGKIPKKFFINTRNGYLISQPGITEYVIRKRETYKVPVQVKQPHSFLKWEFETECHSISFGLEYSNDYYAKPKVLIPVQRIYVNNRTESGEYFCDIIGIYRLIFDNSFSRFTSKRIYYKFTVWA